MKIYTGIGSRETPDDIMELMQDVAFVLGRRGCVLRSGGANGADSAFEAGAILSGCRMQIFLPWNGFNERFGEYYTHDIPKAAFDLAETLHPVWGTLKQGVKKLHARNTQQILGQDLKTPSDLVICWTPNGKPSGGTATAIKLAMEHNIPVRNLKNPVDLAAITKYVKSFGELT